jgi:hypothetical protein
VGACHSFISLVYVSPCNTSCCGVNGRGGECSVDDQVAKDIVLVDAIAEKQAQVFSDECKLFPADVQIMSNSPV